MRILTNLKSFPKRWQSSSGVLAKATTAHTVWDFIALSSECDVILIDCDPRLTLKLSALFIPFWFRRKPIVAVDLVLRRPATWKSKLAGRVTKLLFSRVDHFIHYFRQLDSYEKYFGIGPDRSSYVPFKSSVRVPYKDTPPSGDEYVLGCFGNSERDFDTFVRAMSKLHYPAVLARPNFRILREHGSKFTIPLDHLPPNVRLIENDGSLESAIRIMQNAKVVVLPILPDRINASGISTSLTAMALGKCVIITEGPGATDVLTDQAVFVPPSDPSELAQAIDLVWNDQDLREQIASSGREYAESCGTEDDLRQRVLDFLVTRYNGS